MADAQHVEAKDADPVVRVRAEAQRFAWSFVYRDANDKPLVTDPDGKEHVYFGTLEVPPGVPVHVTLFSPDVIHAFYVPKFLFKRDVVPQREQQLRLHRRPGRRRPDVPRPVRRAVRDRPRRDDLRGPGHASLADVPGLAPGADRHPRSGRPPPAAATRQPASGEPAAGQRPRAEARHRRQPGSQRQPGGRRPDASRSPRANLAYDKNALEAPAGPALQHRVREQRRRRAAQRRDPRRRRRRSSSTASIVTGPEDGDLPGPGPGRPGPTSSAASSTRPDDRHADGQVRSPHGDHRADARRHVPERPVRVGDDDRPQEDRHPLRDQLVRLLLHRRPAGARRAHASWRSRTTSSSRPMSTTSCSRCTRR